MNTKKHWIFACLLALCIFFASQREKLPPGLKYDFEEVPRIDSISGEKYEAYEYHFPPAKAAVYIKRGKEYPIDKNDPRLIKLINLIAYSASNGFDTLLQGIVEGKNLEYCLNTKAPMLDISFDCIHDENDSKMFTTPRVIVCGQSCLVFFENASDDTVYVEYWNPYNALPWREGHYYDIDWGDAGWLNLLEYVGFE